MGTKDILPTDPITQLYMMIINNSQINKDVEENLLYILCNYLYLQIFNVLMIFMFPQSSGLTFTIFDGNM